MRIDCYVTSVTSANRFIHEPQYFYYVIFCNAESYKNATGALHQKRLFFSDVDSKVKQII